MKRKFEELFVDLRVADVTRDDESGVTLFYLESMTSDALAITVSVSNEIADQFDLGDYDQNKH